MAGCDLDGESTQDGAGEQSLCGVVALIVGLLGAAYARRIAAEERLLRRELSGYTTYSERTANLVPFLW